MTQIFLDSDFRIVWEKEHLYAVNALTEIWPMAIIGSVKLGSHITSVNLPSDDPFPSLLSLAVAKLYIFEITDL